ncbi:MAG: hypothetical protein WC175_04245 [Candidatus Dojkabacteria bacterium]
MKNIYKFEETPIVSNTLNESLKGLDLNCLDVVISDSFTPHHYGLDIVLNINDFKIKILSCELCDNPNVIEDIRKKAVDCINIINEIIKSPRSFNRFIDSYVSLPTPKKKILYEQILENHESFINEW